MQKIRKFKSLAINGGKPLFKYKEKHFIGNAEKKVVNKILKSGELSGFSASANEEFFGGRYVKLLEKNFKKKFKTKYAIAFNSATTALYAAIMSIKPNPGDEIITTPYTMHATATSILQANCIPIFAEVSKDDFNLSPESIIKKITKKTKAIILVNLFGQSGRSKELLKITKKNKIKLIEDNSQSPGATTPTGLAGTIGDIGIFSFNRHKTIQSGEGGVMVCKEKKHWLTACLVRNHGEAVVKSFKIKDIENTFGLNFRMTEIEAGIANEQLKKLKKLNFIKQKNAKNIISVLKKFDFFEIPKVKKGYDNVFYFLPLIYKKKGLGLTKSTFCKILSAEGLSFRDGYREPLYHEPLFKRKIGFGKNGWPFSFLDTKRLKTIYDVKNFASLEKIQKEKLIIFNQLNFSVTFDIKKKLSQLMHEIIKYKNEF